MAQNEKSFIIFPNLHRPPQNKPSNPNTKKSSVGIAFNARTVSRSLSSIDLKRFPRSGLLSFWNSQKSHGAKSVEYGGCGATWIEFLAKNSRKIRAVCDGALSWR